MINLFWSLILISFTVLLYVLNIHGSMMGTLKGIFIDIIESGSHRYHGGLVAILSIVILITSIILLILFYKKGNKKYKGDFLSRVLLTLFCSFTISFFIELSAITSIISLILYGLLVSASLGIYIFKVFKFNKLQNEEVISNELNKKEIISKIVLVGFGAFLHFALYVNPQFLYVSVINFGRDTSFFEGTFFDHLPYLFGFMSIYLLCLIIYFLRKKHIDLINLCLHIGLIFSAVSFHLYVRLITTDITYKNVLFESPLYIYTLPILIIGIMLLFLYFYIESRNKKLSLLDNDIKQKIAECKNQIIETKNQYAGISLYKSLLFTSSIVLFFTLIFVFGPGRIGRSHIYLTGIYSIEPVDIVWVAYILQVLNLALFVIMIIKVIKDRKARKECKLRLKELRKELKILRKEYREFKKKEKEDNKNKESNIMRRNLSKLPLIALGIALLIFALSFVVSFSLKSSNSVLTYNGVIWGTTSNVYKGDSKVVSFVSYRPLYLIRAGIIMILVAGFTNVFAHLFIEEDLYRKVLIISSAIVCLVGSIFLFFIIRQFKELYVSNIDPTMSTIEKFNDYINKYNIQLSCGLPFVLGIAGIAQSVIIFLGHKE